MEIRPASLAMIQKGRKGGFVAIEDDVQGVANALHEIDPHIRLRYSEAGEYFVVYWLSDGLEEGDGYMITTATELDHRLVQKMREIYHRCQDPRYSLADELERNETADKRLKDHEHLEKHGEMYEQMAHAMRHDLGYDQHRIYVPEAINAR